MRQIHQFNENATAKNKMMEHKKILVGKIVAPQGIRGEVRVQTFTDTPIDFQKLDIKSSKFNILAVHFFSFTFLPTLATWSPRTKGKLFSCAGILRRIQNSKTLLPEENCSKTESILR